MANLVKVTALLIFCVSMIFQHLPTRIYAETLGAERPAVVVYKTGSRIYLSLGRLDGLSRDWMVSRMPKGIGDVYESLTWISDDLCRVEPRSGIAVLIDVGDTLWLAQLMHSDNHPTHTTLRWGIVAYPEPTLRTPVTLNDLDLREALYDHQGDFIEKIETDESGNSVWYLWPDKEKQFVGDGRVDADIIMRSLKRLCSQRGPFSVWSEYFKLIKDTLFSAKVNPFAIQTNYLSYCGRRLSFVDTPGFYVIRLDSSLTSSAMYPAGSGCYEIVDVSDSVITLCGRDAMFDYDLIDTIYLQVYDSYETAKLALELGESDIIDIAPYDVKRFEDNYEVISTNLDGAVFLSVNNAKPYFADNLFSAALNYLIDKKSLCRVPLGGMVEPIVSPPLSPDSGVSFPFEFDSKKGRKLLHQIDYLPKFMSLLVANPCDPGLVRTAEYIRGVLAREGILLTVYLSRYSADQTAGDDYFELFDLMLARLDDPAGTGAQLIYQSYYHDDFDEIESNRSLFHSSEIDALFGDYFSNCFDKTKRGREALRKIIYDHINAPSGVWLYSPVRFLAVSPKVLSLKFLSGGIVDLKTIEVE